MDNTENNNQETVQETVQDIVVTEQETVQETERTLVYEPEKDPDIYRHGKVGFPEENRKNNIDGTLGLDDEFPDEVLQQIKLQALKNLELMDYKNIDKNLDEDEPLQSEYNFVVISFAGPEFKAKTEINGFRLMGAFKTIEEAVEYIDYIRQDSQNKIYDTGILEMYKWVPTIPFDSEKTQEYVDNFMNDIVINYKIEREEARIKFETRKTRLMENTDRFKEKELDQKEENTKLLDLLPDVSSITNNVEEEIVNIHPTQARLRKLLKERESQKESQSQSQSQKENNNNKNSNRPLNAPKKRLSQTKTKIEGQNYAIVSFVGNTGSNKRAMMKIKGIFDNYQECDEKCKELRDIDDTYDMLITEMYKWVPCDPEVSNIKQIHTDDKLNTLLNTTEEESVNIKRAEKLTRAEITDVVENIDLNTIENDILRKNNDGTVRL